ncbi:MAG: proline--tRNA ligase [Planctomycetes bacterium]|nr:proline--tRNA ligase [Planctomycetota bacterium]
MRFSQAFLYTLREDPADTEVVSHALLARTGFIQKLMAGVYIYAPPMWRTLKKISQIVREEMDRAGAQEAMLPIAQPRDIWVESGRWERYIKEGLLFHFEDRKGAEVCLGPTHEEVVTTMVKRAVKSYKQLPLNVYQIQTKFRDEIRPRFGLMRGREFIMKDAYSFDVDEDGQDVSYGKMRVAYQRIFERCGLSFTIVQADAGAIGGKGGSEEFMVNADTGEDAIIVCRSCGYSANAEKAETRLPEVPSCGDPRAMRRESTPDIKSVEQLHATFPDVLPGQMVKTILYVAVHDDREEPVAVLMRGDREVNEIKLGNHLQCVALRLMTDEEIVKYTGAKPGFAGPVGLGANVRLIADESVRDRTNFLCGANETDYHLLDVNFGRDVAEPPYVDLVLGRGGDGCCSCGATVEETRGIEVGHIFKLGTKYSIAMGALFMGEDGKEHPFVMGCYGIGVSRIAAAAVEQNHDDKGIVWPLPIAPWHCEIIRVVHKDETQAAVAEKLYEQLEARGVECLLDDRKLAPGVKFNDADLIGIPLRIVVGRGAKDGIVEFLERCDGQAREVPLDEVVELVADRVAAATRVV